MSRTTMQYSLLAATLLAGAWATAHADVYRWVGQHGVVHYSDRWRPGATLISTATGTPSDSSSPSVTPSLAAEDKAADRQIQRAADERTVLSTEAKLRAERCKKARAVYDRLIVARRLYTTDKRGHRHYLSDAEADASRVKAREIMTQLCGTGSGS